MYVDADRFTGFVLCMYAPCIQYNWSISLSLCRWHFDVNLCILPLPILTAFSGAEHLFLIHCHSIVEESYTSSNQWHTSHFSCFNQKLDAFRSLYFSVVFMDTSVMVWLFSARKLSRCLVEDHPSKCRKKQASLAMDYLFLGLSHFLVANRHSILVAGNLYQAGLFWKIWRTTWPHPK